MKVPRALLVVLAACATAAAVGALPGAESATRKACPTDGRTVVANEQVRVFRRVSGPSDRVYACLVKTGKLRKLGDRGDGGGGVELVRIARAHVAWDRTFCGSTVCVGDVRTLDMRTGKLRVADARGDEGSALDLDVTNTGAIAWTRGSLTGKDEKRIYKLDAAGEGVLDSGSSVDLHSLATDGRRVYWMSGGAPRSAPLE